MAVLCAALARTGRGCLAAQADLDHPMPALGQLGRKMVHHLPVVVVFLAAGGADGTRPGREWPVSTATVPPAAHIIFMPPG